VKNALLFCLFLALAAGCRTQAIHRQSKGAEDLAGELMSAALSGNVEEVKSLLEKGANVNAKDKTGRTALVEAVVRGDTELTKLLLDKGAEANVKVDGSWTPLMYASSSAVYSEYREIADLLRQHRAQE